MITSGPATRARGDNIPNPFEHVTVVGGGAWGTALAIAADRAKRRTTLWARDRGVVAALSRSRRNPRMPQHPVPAKIRITSDLAFALERAELVILAVPSQSLRAVARRVEALSSSDVPVVICSKGVEAESGALMTRVVGEEMPDRRLAVLSGPSFAEEVAAGQPTAVTIASRRVLKWLGDGHGNLALHIAVTLRTSSFLPYLSDDPVGVEVCGAVKNVLAIACGIAEGRGLGSNARAALITRGLAEVGRLVQALGGRQETVSGLAGIGDLTLTCASEQSRNFSFGRALGEGKKPAAAQAGGRTLVEGAINARSIMKLARRLDVDMPICDAVDAVLHRGLPIDAAIQRLLTRPIRAEAHTREQIVRLPNPLSELELRSG